jgi:hypothetical protein
MVLLPGEKYTSFHASLQAQQRRFYVKNTGDLSVSVSWKAPAPFSIEPLQSHGLEAGMSQTFTASFTASEACVYTASVVCILSSGGSSVLKMSAIGKFPYISIDCSEVDHGGVLVGQASQRIVRLINRSLVSATYRVRQQKPTDDEVFTIMPSKGQIAPGCWQELQLRFTPETAGTLSNSIEDINVVGGNTLHLQQRGSAMSAVVTLSERFLEFGDVQIGRTVRKVLLSCMA